MRPPRALAGLLGLLVVVGARARADGPEPLASITQTELSTHVKFLSSDDFKGRESGTPEGDRTADYVAGLFKEYGLKPLGDGQGAERRFHQKFKLPDGREASNLLGLIEGSDPAKKKECLVIGAHHDHVGLGHFGSRDQKGDGQIHNGADDNASGTASLLELAQAFVGAPARRSLLLMSFAAEEKGLLGSKHWCEHPTQPLGTIVTMINLDMVGRSKEDYLFVGGLGTGTLLKSIVARHNKEFRFKLEEKPGGMGPSDFEPFYRKDVPVLFFFTNVHEDYHRPGDDWEKVNFQAHERITRLTYKVARDLLDGDGRPKFQEDDSTALPDSMLGGRRGPVLGVETAKTDQGELAISEVRAKSAAEKAGLKAGDVLLALGKDKIDSQDTLQRLLSTKKVNDVVALKVRRKTKTLVFNVKLRAP
jgi:hypothetical protein